jgi:hypothetical protein
MIVKWLEKTFENEKNNNKNNKKMFLLEPCKGSTILMHFRKNAKQKIRIDSQEDGSELDSGIRYAYRIYIYFFFSKN